MGTIRMEAASTGDLAVGSATLRSREDLNGAALLQIMSGDTITNEASVRFSPPIEHFTVYIDNVNNARSGYSVANFGTVPMILNATLRNKAGAALATAKTPNLAPGQQFTEFADKRFAGSIGPGFEGSIEFNSGYDPAVVSDGPGWRVGAVGFRYDNPLSDVFTTIPVILNVESDFLLSLAAFPAINGRYASSDRMSTAQGLRADPVV